MSAAETRVVDVAFALTGTTLPADYVDALTRAIELWLPWLAEEPAAGIHPLRAATTTHGLVAIAHRTKLVLRLPAARAQASRALCGQRLDVGGEAMVAGAATERPLVPSDTIYAQRVVTGATDERAFHDDIARWVGETEVRCEFLAGRQRRLTAGGREIVGYALALHGLAPEDALRVQAEGIGGERRFGCGIFVPHKAIATPAQGGRTRS